MTGTGANTANWLRGQDSNLRSPAYETGAAVQAPLPRHEEKARRSMEVRRSGGSRREMVNRSRARELPTGTVRTTEPAPVESLTANGRRRSGWQGTAVREEVEQPIGMRKGGASFGSLRHVFVKIRTKDLARDTRKPRYLDDSLGRYAVPLSQRTTSDAEIPSESRKRLHLVSDGIHSGLGLSVQNGTRSLGMNRYVQFN